MSVGSMKQTVKEGRGVERARQSLQHAAEDGLHCSPMDRNTAKVKTAIYTPQRRRFEKTDLFWLAYLIFFVIEPLERRSPRYWAECLAIMAVFIVMYVGVFSGISLRSKYGLIAGMVVMGALTIPFNGGGTAFIIYASAILPFILPSAQVIFPVIGAEALLVGVEEWRLHFVATAIAINVFFTVVVGVTNLFFAEKQHADCKLRMQAEEIEALAAVAERERIARDLHDVLGHTLSVIVLKSELANRLLQRELAPGGALEDAALRRAQHEIEDVERTARTALTEVREAIGGYRARGLGAEVESARGTLAAAGVTLITESGMELESLSPGEETVLALALREAVTNIVRHARATECRLRLVMQDGRRRLCIRDNGSHAAAHEGNGLRGMRERVESMGGQLSVSRESGTQIVIEIPQRLGAAM